MKEGDNYRIKEYLKRPKVCNWHYLITVIKIEEEYTDLKIHWRSLINPKLEAWMWDNGFLRNYDKCE